jgi:hypothetical protein
MCMCSVEYHCKCDSLFACSRDDIDYVPCQVQHACPIPESVRAALQSPRSVAADSVSLPSPTTLGNPEWRRAHAPRLAEWIVVLAADAASSTKIHADSATLSAVKLCWSQVNAPFPIDEHLSWAYASWLAVTDGPAAIGRLIVALLQPHAGTFRLSAFSSSGIARS